MTGSAPRRMVCRPFVGGLSPLYVIELQRGERNRAKKRDAPLRVASLVSVEPELKTVVLAERGLRLRCRECQQFVVGCLGAQRVVGRLQTKTLMLEILNTLLQPAHFRQHARVRTTEMTEKRLCHGGPPLDAGCGIRTQTYVRRRFSGMGSWLVLGSHRPGCGSTPSLQFDHDDSLLKVGQSGTKNRQVGRRQAGDSPHAGAPRRGVSRGRPRATTARPIRLTGRRNRRAAAREELSRSRAVGCWAARTRSACRRRLSRHASHTSSKRCPRSSGSASERRARRSTK